MSKQNILRTSLLIIILMGLACSRKTEVEDSGIVALITDRELGIISEVKLTEDKYKEYVTKINELYAAAIPYEREHLEIIRHSAIMVSGRIEINNHIVLTTYRPDDETILMMSGSIIKACSTEQYNDFIKNILK